MSDDIVKVKRKDLQALIDTNVEAYNLLDEITTSASDVSDRVSRAYSALENAPSDINDYIVEDEEESKEVE